MNNIGSRLKQVGEYFNFKSLRSFEKEVGISTGIIRQAISNDGAIGSDKVGKILLKFPNINATWLLTGEGEMIRERPAYPNPVDLVQEPLPAYDTKLEGLKRENELLRKMLEGKDKQLADKEKIIRLLEEKMKRGDA